MLWETPGALVKSHFFSFLFFFFEREREQGRVRERGRERESQVGPALSVQSPMWGLNPRTVRS